MGRVCGGNKARYGGGKCHVASGIVRGTTQAVIYSRLLKYHKMF
jgi:hypothetical protein